MARLLLPLLVLIAVVLFLRRLGAVRRHWQRALQLPGRWRAELDTGHAVLDLTGGPASGTYSERTLAGGSVRSERGQWRLRGSELWLRADGGDEDRCEVQLFGDGSLGLHGARRRQRVYRRAEGVTLQQVD